MSIIPLLASNPPWLAAVAALVILLGALGVVRSVGRGRPHS